MCFADDPVAVFFVGVLLLEVYHDPSSTAPSSQFGKFVSFVFLAEAIHGSSIASLFSLILLNLVIMTAPMLAGCLKCFLSSVWTTGHTFRKLGVENVGRDNYIAPNVTLPISPSCPLMSHQIRPHRPSPQGSLTVVDPDHGATLRSSWSIDNSEELGNLEFGFSLDYDAVRRSYVICLGCRVRVLLVLDAGIDVPTLRT